MFPLLKVICGVANSIFGLLIVSSRMFPPDGVKNASIAFVVATYRMLPFGSGVGPGMQRVCGSLVCRQKQGLQLLVSKQCFPSQKKQPTILSQTEPQTWKLIPLSPC
ncbi:hypothetical protein Nepgr_012464 [Nepenthes gracilis]|uniref:Uncharacterized protein n=1 Tax=Nepenthes gracilis TaxID=150966 RepID=A0AAD3SG17_NEPGR|nr:hypothetical protein Nepgr_012464 [Nepenthes gracilis]